MIAPIGLPRGRARSVVRVALAGGAVELALVVAHALLGAALDGRALAAAMAGTAPSWSLALGAFLVLARIAAFVVVPAATVFACAWAGLRAHPMVGGQR